MSWVGELTDFLCEQKQAGVEFGDAWEAALFAFPPRLRELGVGGVLHESLFQQTGAQALEWWRRICEAAYVDAPAADGSPSRLRGLKAALEDAGPSSERPGVRVVRASAGWVSM